MHFERNDNGNLTATVGGYRFDVYTVVSGKACLTTWVNGTMSHQEFDDIEAAKHAAVQTPSNDEASTDYA